MSTSFHWSQEALDDFRQLRRDGLSYPEIGARYNRCGCTIRKALATADHRLPIIRPEEYAYNTEAIRRATRDHLKDILKEHGYGARWRSVAIRSDCLARHVPAQHSYISHNQDEAALYQDESAFSLQLSKKGAEA